MARETEIDPDLARVVAAWPKLPEDAKAGILELVEKEGLEPFSSSCEELKSGPEYDIV